MFRLLLTIILIALVVSLPKRIKTHKNISKILYINEDIEEVNIKEPVEENYEEYLDTEEIIDDATADEEAERLLEEIKNGI
ncbi:hypothetical protein [Clostridium paraputrificum]|uniref:Uncharacterized protein n=1 Tax=Clostridium paraputrificum TaxID=29363 RepID=A0A6N3FBQ6_9CLOT